MILKLGMKHQAMELYKVCINDDPGMTLTFFYGKVNCGCEMSRRGYIYIYQVSGETP